MFVWDDEKERSESEEEFDDGEIEADDSDELSFEDDSSVTEDEGESADESDSGFEDESGDSAVDIVGDESELDPTHEPLDMAGESDDREESFEVEAASSDDEQAELESEDEDADFAEVDEVDEVDEADDGGESSDEHQALQPFDPMELPPKVREMHDTLSLRAQIEAALFAAPKPVKASDLVELVSHTSGLKEVEKTIQDLKEDYATREGGFTLEYVKGMGYQFQTVPAAAPIMEGLFSSRPRPISRAALETLSIIAYRQPCTRAVVEFIRGVDSGSIIKNLMDRELIKCVGRKEDAGRPMLFGTTDEFLAVFGIRSIDELPSLQSFQPASETLQQALDELDELEREVDVEDFVGDESESHAEIGDGLLDEEELAANSEEAAAADADEAPQPAEASTEAKGLSAGSEEELLTSDGAEEELLAAEEAPEAEEQTSEAELELAPEETIEASDQAGYEESATAKPIQGAVKADDQYDDETDRQDDEDPKVDSADGEILTAGGREVDPGGSDLS